MLDRRRLLLTVLVLTASGTAALSLLHRSDRDVIIERVGELADVVDTPQGFESPAARRERLERAVPQLVSQDVLIDIPELGRTRGRDVLVGWATRAASAEQRVDIELGPLEVRVEAEQATVTGEAVLELATPSQLTEERRRFSLRLEQQGGSWRVVAITAAARTHEEPEARP